MQLNSSELTVEFDKQIGIEEQDDYEFKWCCWRPKFCMKCKNWLYIFVFICICCFTQNLIASGIGSVILSTLEKEFYLTSFESGLFLAIFDLASFVAAPVVGYLGDLKSINKMRLISINLLFMTVGAYMIGFLIFYKSPDLSIYKTTQNSTVNTCMLNQTSNLTRKNFECQSIQLNSALVQSSNNLKYVLYFANIIIGFGCVALYSVGIAYVEIVVPAKRSSICQAIFYGSGKMIIYHLRHAHDC
jgi:MFS family permease